MKKSAEDGSAERLPPAGASTLAAGWISSCNFLRKILQSKFKSV